jgi:hypothetical protein
LRFDAGFFILRKMKYKRTLSAFAALMMTGSAVLGQSAPAGVSAEMKTSFCAASGVKANAAVKVFVPNGSEDLLPKAHYGVMNNLKDLGEQFNREASATSDAQRLTVQQETAIILGKIVNFVLDGAKPGQEISLSHIVEKTLERCGAVPN